MSKKHKNRMKLKETCILMLVVSTLVICGCATYKYGVSKQFSPYIEDVAGKGVLFIIRPTGWYYGGITWPVYVDGEQKAVLPSGSYVAILLEPGKHYVQVENSVVRNVEILEGEKHYLETKISGLNAVLKLLPLNAIEGQEEISKYPMIKPDSNQK